MSKKKKDRCRAPSKVELDGREQADTHLRVQAEYTRSRFHHNSACLQTNDNYQQNRRKLRFENGR